MDQIGFYTKDMHLYVYNYPSVIIINFLLCESFTNSSSG